MIEACAPRTQLRCKHCRSIMKPETVELHRVCKHRGSSHELWLASTRFASKVRKGQRIAAMEEWAYIRELVGQIEAAH